MSAPKTKAGRGERQQQALEAIKGFERDRKPWGSADLAKALNCSQAQAGALISALALSGSLVRGNRVVELRDALITAEAAAAA